MLRTFIQLLCFLPKKLHLGECTERVYYNNNKNKNNTNTNTKNKNINKNINNKHNNKHNNKTGSRQCTWAVWYSC